MLTFRPMNPDDLIKAAPELVKGVGALAAAVILFVRESWS